MSDAAAILITPRADIVQIDLPDNTDARLTVMRAVIRCHFVDVVRLTDRLDMWIDDDGYEVQEVNRLATLLAARFGYVYQHYYGPVLLTGGADGQGETLPLTPERVKALLTTLK